MFHRPGNLNDHSVISSCSTYDVQPIGVGYLATKDNFIELLKFHTNDQEQSWSNPGAIVHAYHPHALRGPPFLRAIRGARTPNLHIYGQTSIKISEA